MNSVAKRGARLAKVVLIRAQSCLECTIGRSRFLSRLYYGIFNPAFSNELYAVLQGRIRYCQERSEGPTNSYLLRRNIHRIEKGLIMEPRRAVFAEDYIRETVKEYAICRAKCTGKAPDSGTLDWAESVLNTYFSSVRASESEVISRAMAEFGRVERTAQGATMSPYSRSSLPPCEITYNNFFQLCKRRRSVRWFDDKRVPRQLIDKALIAGSLAAPSACNRQPYRFLIFDDPPAVRQLASVPMGTAGFFQQFPVIAIVVGDLSAYFSERDRHLIYIDSSMATMSFILALETMNLSSCVINWPDIASKEREIRDLIKLTPTERIVFFCAIGYAREDGQIPFSHKKSIEEIRSYNQGLKFSRESGLEGQHDG